MDNDLDAEIKSHIDLATDENLRRGLSAQEARRQALIRFGGVERAKEQQRETRGLPFLDVMRQDLRFTFRTLLRDRGFTVVAVLILALGIGANIVVFSVVNTILLRPLPFHDSQQLTWISGNNGEGGLSDTTYRVDWLQAYQRNNQTMQNVSGFVPYLMIGETKLMHYGDPKPVSGIWVLDDFFQTLGVQPALGRLFTARRESRAALPLYC